MLKVNEKVEAYKSQCIGFIITSFTYEGEITKVNQKSFIAHLNKCTKREGNKVVKEISCGSDVKFTFWKTTSDGRNIYRSEGNIYGMVTFA